MSTAEHGVRATMQRYYEGARDGDIDKVRSTFHPQARMSGYLQGNLHVGGPEPFYDAVMHAPAPAKSGEPFQSEITRVEIAGPIASVTVVEGPYLGMQFHEFFHLLETDGRWLIVSKTFMHR